MDSVASSMLEPKTLGTSTCVVPTISKVRVAEPVTDAPSTAVMVRVAVPGSTLSV